MSGFRNDTYDDRDRSHINYQGGWFFDGSWNASNTGDTGTLTSTSDLEANLTFTFPTPAIAFYYFGIPRCCGGFYGICIDCDPNNRIFLPIDAVNRSDDGHNPPVVLFSQTFKEPGVHEIIIRNLNDTRFGKSQITIDKIVLEVVDPTATSSSASDSGSTQTSSQASSTTSAPSIPSSPASKPSTPVGAIVGGVVAGCLAMIAALLLFLWYRRRQSRDSISNQPPSAVAQNPSRTDNLMPEPFMLPQPEMRSLSAETSVPSSLTSPSTAPSTRPSIRKTRRGHKPQPSTTFTATTDSTEPVQSTLSLSTTPSSPPSWRSRLPRREVDAGPVSSNLEDEDDNTFTLPPDYRDVFTSPRS